MKTKKKQNLTIPFNGLKEGIHQFEFEINSTFFEQFDYSIIENADFTIKVRFEKKATLFNLHFNLEGEISMFCDRCTDPLTYKASGKEDLIIKFGEDEFNSTDEIKIISHAEHELDLTKEVYEYVHLLLPNKTIHETEAECNSTILEKLDKLNQRNESNKVDPRWSALSKLKDNND